MPYRIEAKYQSEKKKRLIAQLEKEQLRTIYQKRGWIGAAVGIIIIAALMVWILILRHRKKMEEKERLEQLQKLRLQKQNEQLQHYRNQLREVTQNFIRKNKQLAELKNTIERKGKKKPKKQNTYQRGLGAV